MHHRVFGLAVVLALLVTVKAIGIDSKLDFGNSRSTASFRKQNTNHRSIFVPVNSKSDASEDFDNIGVVCTSGGCNTTESTNTTGSAIQTDILVHVQTKVDLDQGKSAVTEETPDVPVVVGYRGSQLDQTIDDEVNRSPGPQTIYVTDLDGGSIRPFSPVPYDLHRYHPALTPTVHTRIDSDSHTFVKYYPPGREGSFYVTKTGSAVPSFGGVGSGTDTETRTNTINGNIPYYGSTYHSHYHGENPPPQLTWYPKKSNTYNPVEFKTVKSSWSPSVWNRRVATHNHVPSLVGSGVQCNCKEVQKTPGVRWYPSTSGRGINDPGSQINDKLAPLNK